MDNRVLSSSLLILGSVLLSVSPGYSRKHEHWGDGLSIDLTQPYEEVVSVVQDVTNDGIIRGTFEYKGTHELNGASCATESDAFPKWTGGGTVLYKIRPGTLAPEHFHESNDQGTVVVRYVVQPISPKGTRLRIDAVFEEDSRHHRHPSDGQVENNEFEAISGNAGTRVSLLSCGCGNCPAAAWSLHGAGLPALDGFIKTERAQLPHYERPYYE